jgi:hypothetical protein
MLQAVSKLANQWIELFRAGKYEQGEFTTSDLDQVVANYQSGNPEFEEAPATIGHPTGEAPAWGWWEGLKREGNVLLGKLKDVVPAFEEMVQSRQFPKRSVGLVKRDSGWNLDHVAFLGAAAPAVKGLADCKFDASSSVVKVDFEENAMAAEDTLFERLKAFFDEKFKQAPASSATATFTEADVKRIAAEAVTVAVAPLKAELKEAKATFAARETTLVTSEITARATAAEAKLKAAGKWIPAYAKMGLPAVFAALAKVTQVVEFGEGAEKKSLAPLDILVNFLEAQQKIVPAGEVYTGQGAGAKVTSIGSVNAGRMAVNDKSVQFAEAIQVYMQEHKGVAYLEAAAIVERANPELVKPGSAAAGAA